jgi:hypothetical protein
MSQRIDPDHNRFHQIVRGQIRKNLQKFMSNADIVGKRARIAFAFPCPASSCRISSMATRTKARGAGAR